MAAATDRFYADLPVAGGFADVFNTSLFRDVPADWHVVVTDVRNSTQAIERGRYREVNLVGASCIIAALNASGGVALPFVFGGDGASLVVPASLRDAVAQALLATQQLAQQQFGLELRVGIVPVATVVAQGAAVRVAKMRVSEHYVQAMFTGGGLAAAERLIKDEATAGPFLLTATLAHSADYSGLECRWQNVPSPRGETHAILVQATSASGDQNQQTYRDVLRAVHEIYGTSEQCHPIAIDRMSLSFSPGRLSGEARVRKLPVWKLLLQNLLGVLFFRFGVRAFGTDWGRYKPDVRDSSDYRKFDEMLRMVLAGTAHTRAQLEDFLRKRLARGELVYGIHAAPHALLTCLVFSRQGNHLHFVDGGDGGYALAAKQMKARLADMARTGGH